MAKTAHRVTVVREELSEFTEILRECAIQAGLPAFPEDAQAWEYSEADERDGIRPAFSAECVVSGRDDGFIRSVHVDIDIEDDDLFIIVSHFVKSADGEWLELKASACWPAKGKLVQSLSAVPASWLVEALEDASVSVRRLRSHHLKKT